MKYPDDPFNPPDAPVPESEFEDEPFTEQISEAQAELRVRFGRWLFTKHWKLRTRNHALRFVMLLLKEEVIRADIRERIAPKDQAEFDRWIEICLGKNSSSNSDAAMLYERILNILRQNKIPIPSDINDFILKFVCIPSMRQQIIQDFSTKDKYFIDAFCKQIISNETGRLNEEIQ